MFSERLFRYSVAKDTGGILTEHLSYHISKDKTYCLKEALDQGKQCLFATTASCPLLLALRRVLSGTRKRAGARDAFLFSFFYNDMSSVYYILIAMHSRIQKVVTRKTIVPAEYR